MKPAPFEYYAPETVDEAVALLAEHGDAAKLLAGGQSLIPTMNFRLAQPAVLVDLNRVSSLAGIEPTGAGFSIGAMTRQRVAERSPVVRERGPLLHETMPWIAHPQIRNRGTVGGSVAHADPAAELPAVMLALDAELRLRGPQGTRSVPATEFFTGLFETALAPTELLESIHVPAVPSGSGSAFVEVSRRHGDYALVGVAASVRVADGRCSEARIALLSVGDGPVLAESADEVLRDEAPSPEAISEAAEIAAHRDIDPPSDIHASAAYRRHLAAVLTRRALTVAVERAGSAGS